MNASRPTPRSSSAPEPTGGVWLGRYARLVAVCTLILIFAGGLVTSTGSGLAVPDWPLSYGMLFPPMVGGILYEHGHRMVAATVAAMMAILCIWIWRTERRSWVRRLGFIAMGTVLAQALLGGITVLLLLPDAVSISHAALAEIFFCLTVTIAVVTSRGWKSAPERGTSDGASSVPLLAAITTGLIYVQIILGAVMRHTGAGLAIPDFPLSYGQIVPPSLAGGVAIHYAHRVGAVVVTLAIVALATVVMKRHAADSWIVGPARLLVLLVVVQIGLGGLTIWTMKAVLPTTAHVAVGASILATSLVLTLRSFRLYRLPEERPEPAVMPRREVTA